MIKCLSHVGLSVSNMEKSLEFYRDFLGMMVLMDLDIRDDRIARVTGVPGAKCRIVHLEHGSTVLELFEYTNPRGNNTAKSMRQCDHGITHLGFEVNDIHKHVKELRNKGLAFLGELVEFRPGVWVAYFHGPDSEAVEFRQQPE